MEKKEFNLETADTGSGKAAGFLSRAKDTVVSAVDLNGDGKINLNDVSIVTNSVIAVVKDRSDKWNEKHEQKKLEREYKMLRPLFEADIDKPDFSLPKLIRIATKDEQHAESEICKDSIGFVFPGKEMDVITLYPEKASDLSLRFHPDMDCEMYYVDPADRNFYIALDEYFGYLRIARISELQRIAQDLGAKHFRVIFKERKKSSAANDIKGSARIKAAVRQGAELEAEHLRRDESSTTTEIAAEMSFIGHKPQEPNVLYFKKDPQIQNLIAMRMSDNSMTHQTYTLNLGNSSGIKENDASKIDAALGAMKITGKATVSSEARKELYRTFEYEIDF